MRISTKWAGSLWIGLALLAVALPGIAGQPIGGIVVKGGKNPGGNMLVSRTNERGELELKGLEAGHYTFTLSAPERTALQKGDAGVPAPAQDASRVAGNPIGGIIVKGGKNPGGNAVVLVVIQGDRMDVTVPEAGDYTLSFSAPDAPSGKSISQPGVKRGAAADERAVVDPASTGKSISEPGVKRGEAATVKPAPAEKSINEKGIK